jgi:hypothetical protein
MKSIVKSFTVSATAFVLAAAGLGVTGRLIAAGDAKSAYSRYVGRQAHDHQASAEPGLLAYVLTGNQQFGAVDLGSGEFLPIGPALPPDVGGGLVPGTGNNLLTLSFSGNLVSLNRVSGVTSVIGPTGLLDCSTPVSPCGPNSANLLGSFNGNLYALDFGNRLYSVNPATGATKLIGPTGMPGITFIPLSENDNGSLNVYDESLFSIGGKLYANFDTSMFNPETGIPTPVIPAAIYQINTTTGVGTRITSTDIGLSAIVNVNDTLYAISAPTGEVVTLNVKTGRTHPVSELDAAAGLISAGLAVPHGTKANQ